MAEPAFYTCRNCHHTWERTEWRTRPNRTPTCPQCHSANQTTDHVREDKYTHQVYGPITKHIGALLNKKLQDPKQ